MGRRAAVEDPLGIGPRPDGAAVLAWYRGINRWHGSLIQSLDEIELYELPFAVNRKAAGGPVATTEGADHAVVPAQELADLSLTEADLDTLVLIIREIVHRRPLPPYLAKRQTAPPTSFSLGRDIELALATGRAQQRDVRAVDSLRGVLLGPDALVTHGSRQRALAHLVRQLAPVLTGDVRSPDPWAIKPIRRRVFFRRALASTCPRLDMLCHLAESERLWTKRPDSAVAALVFYPWFNSDVRTERLQLPRELVDLLVTDRRRLEGYLPDSLRALTAGWPLVMSDTAVRGGAAFWVRAVPAETGGARAQGIFVSPVLVRAVFLESTEAFADVLPDLATLQSIPYRRNPLNPHLTPPVSARNEARLRARTVEDWHSLLNAFGRRFLGRFRFAVAHELAHVYLGRSGVTPEERELPCDCYAVWHLRMSGAGLGQDVFESFGLRSVREGSAAQLWGHGTFSDAQVLRARGDSIRAWTAEPVEDRLAARCASVWRDAPAGS